VITVNEAKLDKKLYIWDVLHRSFFDADLFSKDIIQCYENKFSYPRWHVS